MAYNLADAKEEGSEAQAIRGVFKMFRIAINKIVQFVAVLNRSVIVRYRNIYGFDIMGSTSNQALNIWRGAIVESVRRDRPDLSARQMAV